MSDPMEPEVIVVGAGPVGLLLGNLLGQAGRRVLILEKEPGTKPGSRAIGITPPSLQILRSLGVDLRLAAQGVKVRRAVVHGQDRVLGEVRFDALPGGYPYVLSLPQAVTETSLAEKTREYPNVTVRRGWEVTGVRLGPDRAEVQAQDAGGALRSWSAAFVCACDGKRSRVREALNIGFPGKRFRPTFLMGDFLDRSDLGDEAHLFFTAHGPVESFPLPGGKRRWIVDTPAFVQEPGPETLAAEVRRRSGFALQPADQLSASPFGVEFRQAERWAGDRVCLCGDAAHVIPPIGGQGMNTGFGDAELCAHFLVRGLQDPAGPGRALAAYETMRRPALRAAARRAALSMWVGTRKGGPATAVRDRALSWLIRLGRDRLALNFSMLNIPNVNLARTGPV